MARTVACGTRQDANVADFVRELIGVESISTETWELRAQPGDLHVLKVRLMCPVAAHGDVVAGVMQHARYYDASPCSYRGAPGIEINTNLMINIAEFAQALVR